MPLLYFVGVNEFTPTIFFRFLALFAFFAAKIDFNFLVKNSYE